jgi:hypothetical protein
MRRTTVRRVPLVGLFALAPFFLLGCGDSKGGVSGMVSYNGKPVTGGTITLHPQAGTNATAPISAQIDPSSNFTSQDLPPGNYQVAIETESVRNFQEQMNKLRQDMPNGGAPNPGGPPIPGNDPRARLQQPRGGPGAAGGMSPNSLGVYVHIPPKYTDPATSGLTAEVTAGKTTTIIFQLKD